MASICVRDSEEALLDVSCHPRTIRAARFSEQARQIALWLPIDPPPGPHCFGKTVVVGHTPQTDGALLNLGHLACVDTGCGFGGLRTAFDVDRGQVWQVDEEGRPAG
jgi:serine/threonine protein phosphatase 1